MGDLARLRGKLRMGSGEAEPQLFAPVLPSLWRRVRYPIKSGSNGHSARTEVGPQNQRSIRLDALRGIAIALVLGRHLNMSEYWHRVGWMGVDLFFVLSGFLISGLLFAEYIRDGRIDAVRFWIRRAFRIYPPFLVLIAVSEIVRRLIYGRWYERTELISELTWTQNYRPAMWWQTWSLAVEEHFYLVLPILLTVLVILNAKDPFARLPKIIVSFAVLEVLLRIGTSVLIPDFAERTHAFPTHLRADSLLFGVLIAYYYHFQRARLQQFVASHRRLLMAGSFCCLIPAMIWEMTSVIMRTAGFTLSYLAFGQILLLTLVARSNLMPRLLQPLAAIGQWSYSIYLWHVFVVFNIPGIAHRLFGVNTVPRMPLVWLAISYIVGSVAVGYVAHAAVEKPAMLIRDRLVPRRSKAMQEQRPSV